jgi:hypothetical protein
MTNPTVKLLVSLTHLVLAITFAAGIILIYTHDDPSDRDVRRAGMAMVSISAAIILLSWAAASVCRSVSEVKAGGSRHGARG